MSHPQGALYAYPSKCFMVCCRPVHWRVRWTNALFVATGRCRRRRSVSLAWIANLPASSITTYSSIFRYNRSVTRLCLTRTWYHKATDLCPVSNIEEFRLQQDEVLTNLLEIIQIFIELPFEPPWLLPTSPLQLSTSMTFWF